MQWGLVYLKVSATILVALRTVVHRVAKFALCLVVALVPASTLVVERYSNTASEWQRQMLADGSIVVVGPHTTLLVDFSHNRRYIRQFGGEATFEVVKDAQRPFIVETDVASVRAVGTKFGVTSEPGRTEVVTAEGTVSIARLPMQDRPEPGDVTFASAGEKVIIDARSRLTPEPANVDIELAWEEGRVILVAATVDEAVREFDKRHRDKVVVPNHPNMARLKIYGEFKLTDPEAFSQFLHKMVAEK